MDSRFYSNDNLIEGAENNFNSIISPEHDFASPVLFNSTDGMLDRVSLQNKVNSQSPSPSFSTSERLPYNHFSSNQQSTADITSRECTTSISFNNTSRDALLTDHDFKDYLDNEYFMKTGSLPNDLNIPSDSLLHSSKINARDMRCPFTSPASKNSPITKSTPFLSDKQLSGMHPLVEKNAASIGEPFELDFKILSTDSLADVPPIPNPDPNQSHFFFPTNRSSANSSKHSSADSLATNITDLSDLSNCTYENPHKILPFNEHDSRAHYFNSLHQDNEVYFCNTNSDNKQKYAVSNCNFVVNPQENNANIGSDRNQCLNINEEKHLMSRSTSLHPVLRGLQNFAAEFISVVGIKNMLIITTIITCMCFGLLFYEHKKDKITLYSNKIKALFIITFICALLNTNNLVWTLLARNNVLTGRFFTFNIVLAVSSLITSTVFIVQCSYLVIKKLMTKYRVFI